MKELEPHQLRVVGERDALDEKVEKLYVFLASKYYDSLDKDEQSLLKMQYYAMKTYLYVLDMRINKF